MTPLDIALAACAAYVATGVFFAAAALTLPSLVINMRVVSRFKFVVVAAVRWPRVYIFFQLAMFWPKHIRSWDRSRS